MIKAIKDLDYNDLSKGTIKIKIIGEHFETHFTNVMIEDIEELQNSMN